MKWTATDRLFFDVIKEYGTRYIIPLFEASSAMAKELGVTNDPSSLTLFGEYDPSTQTFVWKNRMNVISYEHIRRSYASLFRAISAIPRLFQSRVPLCPTDADVIPFLMKIIHPAFHILYATSGEKELFFLVKLPLKDMLPIDQLEGALSVYRLGLHLPVHRTRRIHRKKSKTAKTSKIIKKSKTATKRKTRRM